MSTAPMQRCLARRSRTAIAAADEKGRFVRIAVIETQQSPKKRPCRTAFLNSSTSPGSVQRPGDLFALEDLDHVAGSDIVVVLERHTAFLT